MLRFRSQLQQRGRWSFPCPRCSTVTEIHTTDAVRLCGGQATLNDVASRLRHDACHCDLVLLLRS
jgi:hypothetical protein